ncbi:MAG: cell envelope biogenesis protein OmpA [Candidatus Contendobacter odensis]|uniref:Cell envelope biogenesis protein OmpA n=1 Tax=Candidatus Contendibacter odensensis TaxID=1400860 RepID=A0A2G6PEJ0_9GAMM|nr:MAG: cell envelope biogenesis protein OmpA [Candidatus Contendobacter odensis]
MAGSLLFILVLSLASNAIAARLIPSEAEILASDQAAVDRLGPDRGAVELKADIRTIQGLAIDTNGVALNLQQAIVDLKAEVRDNEILIQLSADVLFDFDKADIKTDAEGELYKVALIIRNKAKGVVAIHGHTDAKGSNEYNQSLSMRRAKAVHLWLAKKGGAQARYAVVGHGETQPVAPNTNPDGTDNPSGRAQNRRVEISIQAVTP